MSGFSQTLPQYKKLVITRDMTAATGSVAYTGVGFKPKALIGMGSVAASSTQYTVYLGICDAGLTGSDLQLNTTTSIDGNFLSFIKSDGSAAQTFAVTSFDADGFTGTWTKAGTPAGTGTAVLLCLG